MDFDIKKFKKVCVYTSCFDKREIHLLDLNTSGGDHFLMFLEQHGVAITEYAKSTGYICWNAEEDICYGIHPGHDVASDVLVTIHIASDFSTTAIQVDNDTMLDFLGV